MKSLLALFLFLAVLQVSAQEITVVQSGKNTGIRGLSVVNDRVIWVSGSNGWVARSTDGGSSWQWQQLKGYEKLDFRDIEALSADKAVMVNAGSPAVILLTEDGGKNWKEVYRNESKDIFLDGMDFWTDEKGLIYGDPINKRMQLLQTLDGGHTWKDISANNSLLLEEGEASFAASGTGIRTLPAGHTWISTGGSVSRIFYSPDFGATWKVYAHPIVQGTPSAGVFSIAFASPKKGYSVGGDYQADTLSLNVSYRTTDGGKTWTAPQKGTGGYRSAVEYIDAKKLIAAGTSGVDYSVDAGKSWKPISKESFNCVRRAKQGTLVVLAGAKGKIALLKY